MTHRSRTVIVASGWRLTMPAGWCTLIDDEVDMSATGEQVMPTYSLVIPVYNEEQTLPELQRRITDIMAQMDGDAEVVLVDDGSSDGSYAMMVELSRRDERFKVVRFSRNFGHQIAVTAGLDYARGQAVIVMDADLQDPPEVVLEMVPSVPAMRLRYVWTCCFGLSVRSGSSV